MRHWYFLKSAGDIQLGPPVKGTINIRPYRLLGFNIKVGITYVAPYTQCYSHRPNVYVVIDMIIEVKCHCLICHNTTHRTGGMRGITCIYHRRM